MSDGMSDGMMEKAREVGRLLGQTSEFKALKRARERVNGDRELVALLNQMARLESEIGRQLQQGETPPEEKREEYEKAFSELQSSSVYQSLVAAQSNFDKVLTRVNEEIGKGMEAGAQSSIILPS